MMIRLLALLTLFSFATATAGAQTLYKQKKSRKDHFGSPGERSWLEMHTYGLQVSFGPNYTFTRLHNKTVDVSPETGSRYNYVQDPAGRLGGFVEIGMMHFNVKEPKILKKDNLYHYFDWGLGFDYIGGKEKTTVNYLDPVGNVVSTGEGNGKFYNGYAYGRITFHRLQKLGGNLHLDYGLGLNGNYAVVGQNRNYDGTVLPATQTFQDPFMLQLHATLGVNIRIKRGDYIVPSIWAPVLGAYEWNSGKPTIQWYSSNYWPVHLQIKWMHMLAKRPNKSGCNTGTEEDRKRNNEYMQNR